MATIEIVILVAVGVGFLGLIAYVAVIARDPDREV
jgi:hypothetical protein